LGRCIPPDDLDIIFPAIPHRLFRKIRTRLYWIPDFLHKHYPQHMSWWRRWRRHAFGKGLNRQGCHIALSSQSAESDCRETVANSTRYVLNFAVTHPPYEHLEIQQLTRKYRITKPYYFSPNQFWQHKNHMTLVKAMATLNRDSESDLELVLTGHIDPRNPHYHMKVKSCIEDHGLNDQVKYIGFIDRREQLCLMKHSIAVVQPSKFEGWSTVIEDAKAMNKMVIASDLAVHRDQLGDQGVFFDATDQEQLARLLLHHRHSPIRVEFDYEKSVVHFAHHFMNIVGKVITTSKGRP